MADNKTTDIKLFNDSWYDKAKKVVSGSITETEYVLHKNGKLSKLYSSFDQLLLENTAQYDRIIRYALFMKTGQLVDEGKLVFKDIELIKDEHELTATRLYCLINLGTTSTIEEIRLCIPQLCIPNDTTLEVALKMLIKVDWFSKLTKYTLGKYSTQSFLEASTQDTTDTTRTSSIMKQQDSNGELHISETEVQQFLDYQSTLQMYQKHLYGTFSVLLNEKEPGYIIVGHTYIRLMSKRVDYVAYILEEANFMMQRIPYRGSQDEIDQLVTDNMEQLRKWHGVKRQMSDIIIREIHFKLINYFMITCATNFVAIRRYSDEQIAGMIFIKKNKGVYRLFERIYDIANNKILNESVIKATNNYLELIDPIIRNEYFVFGDFGDFAELFEHATQFTHHGQKAHLITYYMDIVYNQTNSIDAKIKRHHVDTIKEVDDKIFQNLYESMSKN